MAASPEPMASETANLGLEPDTDISLQVADGPRMLMRVLGKVPDQYLVLRDPHAGNGLSFEFGDVAILRYLQDGVVYAFRTLVLHTTHTPEPLLFVSYPQDDIHQHRLRNAERLLCNLPCQLTLNEVATLALMMDISETGCQCALPRPAQRVPDGLEGRPVRLALLGFSGEDSRAAGIIQRCSLTEYSLRLGIRFRTPQPGLFSRAAGLLQLTR